MKILVCPLNGPRPVSEFVYGGEIRRAPDPDACTDEEWSGYVFNRSGSPGMKYEWWCHIASGFWFIVLRDTLRDVVIETHFAEALRRGLLPLPASPVATSSGRAPPSEAPPGEAPPGEAPPGGAAT